MIMTATIELYVEKLRIRRLYDRFWEAAMQHRFLSERRDWADHVDAAGAFTKGGKRTDGPAASLLQHLAKAASQSRPAY